MALLDADGWKPGADGVRVKDGKRLTAMYQPAAVMEPDTAVEIQAELVMSDQDEIQPLRWVSGDPSCLEVMFHSRNIPHAGYGKFNYAHLDDKTLDGLLESAAGAPDAVRRDELYGQAQKLIMDAAVFVPVHDQVNAVAYRAEKTGYRWARTRWNVKFYDVEWAK
jgi:peptide/nickel transport system substrate-binding protein